MSEFTSDFLIQLLVAVIIIAITGFGAFITKMWFCLNKQSKSLFRLKKGFILYMKLQAKQTQELHPKTAVSMSDAEIDEIIKEMLTDDEGKI